MTEQVRVLARLDIKGQNVIKGINLEGLRVVGKPEELAKKYYNMGVDGLIFMDSVASLYGRNHLNDLVSYTAKSIFVPMTVGGGIRSIDNVESLLRAGADKIAINTQLIKTPTLINEIAKRFGVQCMVLGVEAKRRGFGQWEAFYDNGREPSGIDVIDWVKQAEDLGVGEILLTSVDNEGTRKGFDIELVKRVNEIVSIPVIASGGFGKVEHIVELFEQTQPSAVAIADALHYSRIVPFELKQTLLSYGIAVRKNKPYE